MFSISDGIDALVRGVDQAAGLLDADQHDLGVRGRSRRGRCRVGSSRPVPRSSAAGRTPPPSRPSSRRTRGRRARRRTGRRRAIALDLDLHAPRHAGLEVLDQRVLRLLSGHAGRYAQADARRAPRLDAAGRADHRRAVDAEHGRRRSRPEQVGDASRRPSARRRRGRSRPRGTALAGTRRRSSVCVASSPSIVVLPRSSCSEASMRISATRGPAPARRTCRSASRCRAR